jgi:hypothetical protein
MVASTRLVAASILVTASSRLLETQTDPAARAMPDAWRPTGTVATLRLVAGSIRETVLSGGLRTQTASGVTATLAGPVGTGTRASTLPVAGSRRTTWLASVAATQTPPAPTAAATGVPGTGRVATTSGGRRRGGPGRLGPAPPLDGGDQSAEHGRERHHGRGQVGQPAAPVAAPEFHQSPLRVQLGHAALQGHGGPAQALIAHGRPP